jgi:hypothetical protein
MQKGPKHKIMLMIGVLLFVASPFVLFLSPDWFLTSLVCTPEDQQVFFGCTKKVYTASFYLALVIFIVGTGTIFWSLPVKTRIGKRIRGLFGGRYQKLKIACVSVVGVVVIYFALLVNPFTSSWFQYPYYKAFCGREPVIGVSGKAFQGRVYITPSMKIYHVGGFDQKLYCSEKGAQNDGRVRAHDY